MITTQKHAPIPGSTAPGVAPMGQLPTDVNQITALNKKFDDLIAALMAGNAPQAKKYKNANLLATGISINRVPTRLLGWACYNNNVAARSVKLYDKVTDPIAGTDIPSLTIVLAANGKSEVFPASPMCEFVNGLGILATVESTDAGSTAPTANDIVVNLFYV